MIGDTLTCGAFFDTAINTRASTANRRILLTSHKPLGKPVPVMFTTAEKGPVRGFLAKGQW